MFNTRHFLTLVYSHLQNQPRQRESNSSA